MCDQVTMGIRDAEISAVRFCTHTVRRNALLAPARFLVKFLVLSYQINCHVENIVSSCAQSVHAIRILRIHGMSEEVIQRVFPECCCRQTDVRRQRLVGLHYGNWSAGDGSVWTVEAVICQDVRSGRCRSDFLTTTWMTICSSVFCRTRATPSTLCCQTVDLNIELRT